MHLGSLSHENELCRSTTEVLALTGLILSSSSSSSFVTLSQYKISHEDIKLHTCHTHKHAHTHPMHIYIRMLFVRATCCDNATAALMFCCCFFLLFLFNADLAISQLIHAKLCHMIGNECNFKNYVQHLGVLPPPKKSVAEKRAFFSAISNNFTLRL